MASLLAGGAGLLSLARPRKPTRDLKKGDLTPDYHTIPPEGHHAYVESRILDLDGNPLPVDTALTAGRQYRLEVHIKPGLEDNDEDNSSGRQVTVTLRVFGREFTIPRPKLSLEVGLATKSLPTITFETPMGTGKHPLHLEVLHEGQLLHLETLEIPVGEIAEPRQTTTTRITSTGFVPDDLEARRARAAQILLLRATDDSIDVEVLDTSAEPLISFDTPHQAEALLTVSQQARERLTGALEGSAQHRGVGRSLDVARADLDAVLPSVARAGTELFNVLFGRGRVRQSMSNGPNQLSDHLPQPPSITGIMCAYRYSPSGPVLGPFPSQSR